MAACANGFFACEIRRSIALPSSAPVIKASPPQRARCDGRRVITLLRDAVMPGPARRVEAARKLCRGRRIMEAS